MSCEVIVTVLAVLVLEPVQGALVWTDARSIGVRGRANFTSERAMYYDRLPAVAEGKVRDPVWNLQRNTAGMYVQFKTCSELLSVNVTYTSSSMTMWHFPSTGVAGLDLYAWDSATTSWRWMDTTKQMKYPSSINNLAALPGNSSSRYRLHLPLYNGVVELYIGHSTACPLKPDQEEYRQVVWYGTSITQGGVASRPGMAFTNWIARHTNHEILNFGFSGNGLMEISVAQYLVQTPDPALFVIDCNWNMEASLIQKNTVPLVKFLRKYHPAVPIILAEDTISGEAWLVESSRVTQEQKRQALRRGYESLLAAGEKNLHYVYREQLFNFSASDDKFMSPTVGGCHPTDLGMKAITDFYASFLPPILSSSTRIADAKHINVPKSGVEHLKADSDAANWGSSKIDSIEDNVARRHTSLQAWTWTNVAELGIMGRAFQDTPTIFNRLPSRAKGVVRDAVWELGLDSTGLFVAFETNATAIAFNYTLTSNSSPLWHMPSSGTSGADLYRFDEGSGIWGFVSCLTQFPTKGQPLVATLAADLPTVEQASRYLLFLPLRKEVDWAYIGVNAGATPPRRDNAFAGDGVTYNGRKPILWYGTSIDQGGVASRPGHTYTNILTRNLGRVVLNLGFAGNGKMEISVAEFLTEVDAELIVIDCLWNMDPALVVKNTGPLVRYFRQSHPNIPILLAEGTRAGKYWFSPSYNKKLNSALRSEYQKLVAAGDKNLHLVTNDNDELYGRDPLVNPTVAGTHPTDLGHWEIASFYTRFLKSFLPDSDTQVLI